MTKFFITWVALSVLLDVLTMGLGYLGSWRVPAVLVVSGVLILAGVEALSRIKSIQVKLKEARELEEFLGILDTGGQVNKLVTKTLIGRAQICAKAEADSRTLANGGLEAVGMANQGFNLESMLAHANAEFKHAQDKFYLVYDLACKLAKSPRLSWSLRLRDRSYKAYITSRRPEQKLELVLCVGSSLSDEVSMRDFMRRNGLVNFREAVPKSAECRALSDRFDFRRSQVALVLLADGYPVYAETSWHVLDLPQMMWGERPVPEPREDLE